MADLRKELINEGLGLIKSIKSKPDVKVDLPDISELEEKLKELYSGSRDTESPNQPPIKQKASSIIVEETTPSETQPQSLPTREETTAELKRRLARELYKAELDLAGGLKIAGKPCTCLSAKHTLMLEAAAEELIAEDPGNTVYSDIIQWVRDNQPKVTVEAIQSGKYEGEYPRMASQFRDFRKRVMGTVAFSAIEESAPPITLEEAKKIAAQEAEREVERKWESQEKKPGA